MFGFTEVEARTYLILAVCQFSSIVVNLLEQPYARSLVVCNTPLNATAGFSGSNSCGDHLHVIDVGAQISGQGQSLENFGKICITLFVSSFANRGRKNAAIIGQTFALVSVMLFFLASFLRSWSTPIYVLAQGLQGMSGISILDEIVTSDVAMQLADSVGVYNRKQMFTTVSMAVFMPMIIFIQYSEFTDFTFVWLVVLMFNLVALLLLVLVFPETMNDRGAEKKTLGLIADTKAEMRSFWELCTTNRFIKYRLLESFMHKMWDWGPTIALPMLMAFFGYSQVKALFIAYLPGFIVSILTMQVAPDLHKKYGYRKAFGLFYFLYMANRIGLNLLAATSFAGLPVMLFFTTTFGVFSGWGGVVSTIEIRLVGQENTARYKAMTQLITFASGTLTSYIYSATFDAQAMTYWDKSLPMLISAFFCVASIPVYLFGNGPLQLEECDKMTAELESHPAVDAKKVE